ADLQVLSNAGQIEWSRRGSRSGTGLHEIHDPFMVEAERSPARTKRLPAWDQARNGQDGNSIRAKTAECCQTLVVRRRTVKRRLGNCLWFGKICGFASLLE